jgi:glycosyltransferase involved in cell wall biosynthesis
VIPAYRAEASIADVLTSIGDRAAWIIVVDDASPDRTATIASAAARRDPRIRLLRHEVNQGVGGAVLTGYREAVRLGAEIVVKMDSDGQTDPAYLPALVDPIVRGQADYTKGNRFVHARQLRSMPLLRRIGNLGLSLLTKLASGYWGIFDPTNGYTAIHAAVIPLLNDEAIARRYFFESSMLLELNLLRAVAKDVYIPSKYGDETSHLSIGKALCQFPGSLLKGLLRRTWIQYFVRDFSIASLYLVVGLFLLCAGSLFGGFHWWWSLERQVATPTGTVMLAVLPIILGVQLLIQAVGLDIQSQPVQCRHGELPAVQDDTWTTTPPRERNVPAHELEFSSRQARHAA